MLAPCRATLFSPPFLDVDFELSLVKFRIFYMLFDISQELHMSQGLVHDREQGKNHTLGLICFWSLLLRSLFNPVVWHHHHNA